MIFDFFKSRKKFSVKSIVDEFGYTVTAQAFAMLICTKFSMDNEICIAQMTQFLREEADAASQGDEYAQNFAKELFDDPADYKGAMNEDAEYPIDEPGGPQQMLVKLSFLMKDENPEFAVKFRCAIVKRIAIMQSIRMSILIESALSETSIKSAFSENTLNIDIERMYPNIRNEINSADKIIKLLCERYPIECKLLLN